MEYIQNCIKSISELTYDNFELIILDNNSNDDTRKYLAETKISIPQTKIILNSTNLG